MSPDGQGVLDDPRVVLFKSNFKMPVEQGVEVTRLVIEAVEVAENIRAVEAPAYLVVGQPLRAMAYLVDQRRIGEKQLNAVRPDDADYNRHVVVFVQS